jgi:hypothetical protein
VNDDHDADVPAQAREIDEGGFEAESRVGGRHGGKHRRVAVGPIDLTGVAAGGPPPGVGSGIEVRGLGINGTENRVKPVGFSWNGSGVLLGRIA